ncbi:hypothetical protein ACQKQA_23555 [Pseudomonas sp. NPDC089530]|uniref:hypothetical protein n=1 Tax=Pseudomonas sp. NPDC089530 TaxID=3390651 RepID=UPI003D064514
MSKSNFEGLMVLGFCLMVLWRVLPIAWNFYASARSTRKVMAELTPTRQLSDDERAALAFLGGPAKALVALAGVTRLPLNKLAHAKGAQAAVYQLRGPLVDWGYAMYPGVEEHFSIQGAEVFMALDSIRQCCATENVVEVVFCKRVGVILSCNDSYCLVKTSAKWGAFLEPDNDNPVLATEPTRENQVVNKRA